MLFECAWLLSKAEAVALIAASSAGDEGELAVEPPHRLRNDYDTARRVEVGPAQPEQFTATKAGRQSHDEERVQAVADNSRE